MTIARNLWHRPQSAYSRPTFEYPGKSLFSYRGVEVFKNPFYGSFDFVLAGAAIMQRAGFNRDSAPKIIDDLLDNKEPCADAVAEHINAHGGNALTYAQYGRDYAAGIRE